MLTRVRRAASAIGTSALPALVDDSGARTTRRLLLPLLLCRLLSVCRLAECLLLLWLLLLTELMTTA